MFKELKETSSKELKESMRTVSHQMESINKEVKIIIKESIEVLKLKKHNWNEKFTRGVIQHDEPEDERTSELENRSNEVF